MKFVVPAAVVGAAALVAAGCALPAAAASAPHAHHAVPAVAATAPATHPLVHPVTAHPAHTVKPAPVKHKPVTTKPAPKKSHVKKPHPKPVVKPVVSSATVTVQGIAGQVTLTKVKGVSSLALSIAGRTWKDIDLGQTRNEPIFNTVKNRSFDSVQSLTQQLDVQFPGASAILLADLQGPSTAS